MVVALPTLCSLATLALWMWSSDSRQTLIQHIEQSHARSDSSNHLLMMMLNAETGVRGYSLTQQKIFLEPYYLARQNLPKALQQLSQDVRILPPDSASTTYQRISQLVQEELQTLDQKIQSSQQATSGRNNTVEPLLMRGKSLMDQLRQELENLQDVEKQDLQRLNDDLAHLNVIITSIQRFVIAVSILSFVGALCLLRQLELELRDREQQLFQSHTLTQAITTNVIDGVLTLDRQGRIETVNPTIVRLFNYDAANLLGQPITKLWVKTTDDQSAQLPMDISQFRLGEVWHTTAYRQNGSPFPIDLSISQLPLQNQFIVVVRDMTERVRTETELKTQADQLAKLNLSLAKTNAKLAKQNQELETITYATAHDLKTPLRGIATLSEWIEDDLGQNLPPESQRHLHLLRTRVFRLVTLIDELLDYSQVGRGLIVADWVNVDQLLQTVLQTLSIPPTFTITIAPGMPAFKTPRSLLQKVFYHLLENAIQHHDRTDGVVTVSLQDGPTYYEFTIADDGPGISPEYFERVFQVFQTLNRKDEVAQTGIGLALVKKIVETMGGEIWLQPCPQRGLAVHFTWPHTIP